MYTDIPVDVKSIEPKILFGLTKRQILGGLMAIIPASIAFLIINVYLKIKDLAMFASVILALPGFAYIVYKKNGLPAEQIVKAYIKWKMLHPQIYKTKINKYNKAILKQRGII